MRERTGQQLHLRHTAQRLGRQHGEGEPGAKNGDDQACGDERTAPRSHDTREDVGAKLNLVLLPVLSLH